MWALKLPAENEANPVDMGRSQACRGGDPPAHSTVGGVLRLPSSGPRQERTTE